MPQAFYAAIVLALIALALLGLRWLTNLPSLNRRGLWVTVKVVERPAWRRWR